MENIETVTEEMAVKEEMDIEVENKEVTEPTAKKVRINL